MAKADEKGTEVEVVGADVRGLVATERKDDPSEIGRRIDAGIMNAPTMEQLFNGNATKGIADVLNEVLTVTDIAINEGRDEFNTEPNSLGVYFVIQTEESGVVTGGARTCVLKLYRAAELIGSGQASYPISIRFFQKDKATSNNRYPFDVELVS